MPTREEHWGVVIDNRDPEQRGRLIIQSDEIAEGDVLEWVDPNFHFVDSDNDNSAGAFWVPNQGALVIVEINAESDAEALGLSPRWKCALYSSGQLPEEFVTNYPQRRGWKTRAGHLFFFDDTEDEKEFAYTHPTGAYIKVNNDGDIILEPASGRGVLIGEGATESMVHGDVLDTYIDNVKTWLDGLVLPVAGASAGPPEEPSPTVPDFLSDDNKVE